MLNTIALPSFVLGYHGTDRKIAEAVLAGKSQLRPSENQYDWLGTGIYFWEHNPERAFQWAKELKRAGRLIGKPAVIGAVINLEQCLNLLDSSALALVRESHETLVESARRAGQFLPVNRKSGKAGDLLIRELDCLVINHAMVQNPGLATVRGVFVEGQPLYPGAGFREKNHIQICVRKHSSVIGYFRVKL